jgi:hypothetical protein
MFDSLEAGGQNNGNPNAALDWDRERVALYDECGK